MTITTKFKKLILLYLCVNLKSGLTTSCELTENEKNGTPEQQEQILFQRDHINTNTENMTFGLVKKNYDVKEVFRPYEERRNNL